MKTSFKKKFSDLYFSPVTNFCRSGQIFKRTADKICPGKKLAKIAWINKTVINFLITCRINNDKRVI